MDVLKELTIVEFAGVLAGPLTGSFFAEHGATVIKIENPKTGGDITRQWRHSGEPTDRISSYYAACNHLKKIHFLDLSSSASHNEVKKLVEGADIVICNHSPAKAKKLGIDYEKLRTIKQDIIYANIKGFNDSDREAYDIVLQAEAGIMHLNGTEKEGPLKLPVAFIDVFASLQLRSAILSALLQKARTGRGIKVEVSLLDSAISSLVNRSAAQLMNGFSGGFNKNAHPNIAPYGELFYSADRVQFVLAVATDRQFLALLEILGLQENSKDFSTNEKRVEGRTELKLLLEPQLQRFEFSFLSEQFLKKKIPFGELKTLDRILQESPHMILSQKVEGSQTFSTLCSAFSWTY